MQRICNFREQMIADEQMQSAHENILRLDQVIREKFDSNIKVRKTVMGVVKDFDINLCRNSTIEELSEELWITSSRYWLSYALIAISAWVNDSKVLAGNAVGESVRTNAIKSNLFFCLLNLRFGRMDVAKKWLREYLRSVIPEEMSDETAVLLQAYINGVFGTDKSLEYEVQSVIDEWVRSINMDEELTEELVNAFERYIATINVNPAFPCAALSQHCGNLAEIRAPYVESFKYDQMIALVDSLDVEMIVQNASNYKQRIDAIITDLITNYDEEEQEIRSQKEYYQLVMDNKGNVEAAEAQYEERQRIRNQTQNFGRKLLDWALYKSSDEVDVHVRKFAFRNAKEWFLTALERWSTAIEDSFPQSYPLTIGDWSAVSNGEDQLELEHAFREHLEARKYQTMYFNTPNIVMLIGFILTLIGGIVMMTGDSDMGFFPYVLLIAAAALAIVIIVRCATAGSKFRRMVNEKLAILAACMSELTKIRKAYFDNIQKKSKLFNMIDHI